MPTTTESPLSRTANGLVQAVNTYEHHESALSFVRAADNRGEVRVQYPARASMDRLEPVLT